MPAHLKRSSQLRRKDYSAFWDSLLSEASEHGGLRTGVDLHIARLVILGAVNWTVEWYDPKQGSVQKVSRQIASLISDGVFLTHEG